VQNSILKLLMAAMLFVSMEGVADAADEQSFHQTHHAHAAGDQWFPDSDTDTHEGDGCEHSCHAHVVGLTSQLLLANMPQYRCFTAALSTRTFTDCPAPPTPPPDA